MIAIISDIHDNLANLKTALDYSQNKKVSALFVLGDITNNSTLKYLAKNFSDQIYLVAGNMEVCDLELEAKKYKNIIYLGRQGGIIEIAHKKVGLCHEPTLADNLLKQNAEIIFYGHTHKPFEHEKAGVKMINPGNPANTFYSASFALWNEFTDELELKIL